MPQPSPLRARLQTLGALILALASLVLLYEGYFRPLAWPPLEESSDFALDPPLTRRLLIICADSVRAEPMRDPSLVPFFHDVAARGIHGDLTVPGPTLTGVSVSAFGTGVTPPLNTASSNFFVPPWPDESLFSLARRAELRLAFFGDDTWYRAFGDENSKEDTYPFSEAAEDLDEGWYPKDREMLPRIESFLREGSWNLACVHFATPTRSPTATGRSFSMRAAAGPRPTPVPSIRSISLRSVLRRPQARTARCS